MANNFFKNGNKAYSENLNDSILIGNAFDWTVHISLPADTDNVFPDNTLVKAKVADINPKPNTSLSIGTTITNNEPDTQEYRITVYPNFNRYGGFKTLSVTGDATFFIAEKGRDTPIASNLNYNYLENIPELKELKEYDIVVNVQSGGVVEDISFVFQTTSADIHANMSQDNVEDLTPTLMELQFNQTIVNMKLERLQGIQLRYFDFGQIANNGTSTRTKTIIEQPEGMNSLVIPVVQNWCTFQSSSITGDALTVTVQNQSGATHNCSSTILVMYYPGTWSL